ncbi:pyridoxamine 5'-phosphate oxidase family protein [Streptomyces sp. NPDC059787]|uniref:pyridoxamine 5'-phosphate oxidase family protein n=1 Tax=Streptomyces sp. NPDC059787 TaxID=3346947 RepID=UPI0036535CBD
MPQNDAFRALGRQKCLRLPAGVPLGRVIRTGQALPAVLPVNFSLDTDASVLLATSPGSDPVRAVDGTVVAFEADEFHAENRSGRSVVVTGRAAVVTGPAGHERLVRTGPASWTPLRETVFVRIGAEMVTGRGIGGATAGR